MPQLKPLTIKDAQDDANRAVARLEAIAAIIAKLEPGLRKWDGKNIDKRMETFLRKECGFGPDDEFYLTVGNSYSWYELKVRRSGQYSDSIVNMNLGYTTEGKTFSFDKMLGHGNSYYFGKAQEDLANRKRVLATNQLDKMVERYDALLKELGEIEAGLKECGVQLPT